MKENALRQPFAYYGGKSRMAHNIIPLIPKHTVYVEPFAGGASLFWRMPRPFITNNDHYRTCLNDTNLLISNFYQQLRDNNEALQHLIENTEYGQLVHAQCKGICKSPSEHDALTQAWAFFVNINQSFGNASSGGWGTGVVGRNLAATWGGKQQITTFKNRLVGCSISCEDALRCIQRWDSPQSLFYCDPPYPGTDQSCYAGYTLQDFNNLVATLNDCKGSFLLSCYSQAVPSDWERFEFSARMSACKPTGDRSQKGTRTKSERKEIVWRRFNRVPVRPEIQKLYDSPAWDCYVAAEQQAGKYLFDMPTKIQEAK